MGDKMKFSVENVSIEDPLPQSKFSKISLDFFASGDNAHDMYVSEDVLNKTAETIYNVPIVWEYDGVLDDAGTHDPSEVPCGFVMKDEPIERVSMSDGRTMLRVVGYLWKKYSGRLMEILERDGGKKPVSVEMSVYETEECEDGKVHLKDYVFEAITILGKFVTPAIDSAGLNVLSFAQDFKAEFGGYTNMDFSIPNSVRENAISGLELVRQSENGGGITAVSIATANYLSQEQMASPEKIRQIHKYFSRRNVEKPFEQNGSKWISWQLYGGDASVPWARGLFDEMCVVDEELVTYFNILPEDDDIEGREEKTRMAEKEKKESKEEEKDEEVTMKKPEDAEMAEAESKEEDMAKPEEKEDSKEDMAESKEEDMASDEEDSKEEDMAEDKDAEADENEKEMADAEQPESEEFQALREYKLSAEAELVGLRQFKADEDKKKVEFEVNAVLAEVKGIFTDEEIQFALDETIDFSFEDIAGWANAQKAKAFALAVERGFAKVDDDGIGRFSFPVEGTRIPTRKSIWDAEELDKARSN